MFNKAQALEKLVTIFKILELDAEMEKRVINKMKRAYYEFQKYQQDNNIQEESTLTVEESAPIEEEYTPIIKKFKDQATLSEGMKFIARADKRDAKNPANTGFDYTTSISKIRDAHPGILTRGNEKQLLAELIAKIKAAVNEPEETTAFETTSSSSSQEEFVIRRPIGAVELMRLLSEAAYYQYKSTKMGLQRLFKEMNTPQRIDFTMSRAHKKLPIDAVLNEVTPAEWEQFINDLKVSRDLISNKETDTTESSFTPNRTF